VKQNKKELIPNDEYFTLLGVIILVLCVYFIAPLRRMIEE
jgi:hypothetical protein